MKVKLLLLVLSCVATTFVGVAFENAQLPPDGPPVANTHVKVLWAESVSLMSAIDGVGKVERLRIAAVQVDAGCYLLIGDTAAPVTCPVP